jgi:hypothetical protein
MHAKFFSVLSPLATIRTKSVTFKALLQLCAYCCIFTESSYSAHNMPYVFSINITLSGEHIPQKYLLNGMSLK